MSNFPKPDEWVVSEKGIGVKTYDCHHVVATTSTSNPNRVRDAYLIAALPNLYDACVKARNALRNCRLAGEQPGETEEILDRAVAKAEGYRSRGEAA